MAYLGSSAGLGKGGGLQWLGLVLLDGPAHAVAAGWLGGGEDGTGSHCSHSSASEPRSVHFAVSGDETVTTVLELFLRLSHAL